MERSVTLNARKMVAIQLLWIVGFAALTAIGARIEVPHQPVPYTLQTFVVLLSGAVLGRRNGALSQALYLLAGAVGMPVFSGASFGLARIIGPTGGYLLAFPLAAFCVGLISAGGRSFFRIAGGMVAGSVVIFLLGTVQLYLVFYHEWQDAFGNGFLIFSWWDCAKIIAAAVIASTMHRVSPRLLP